MNQLIAITKNTFLQTVRQPVYGIIVLVTLGGLAMSPSITGWTLDDDNKMLRDIGLSTLLIQGLFLACFAASTVLDTEIEDKTVLTVAAKPVSRWQFILGKYLGILGALVAAHYVAGIAFFMTMRHGVLQTARDTSDPTVLILGPGVMLIVLVVAGVMNYLYERRFLPTVFALALPLLTLSTVILLVVDRDWKLRTFETTQTMDNLPQEVTDPAVFKDIIEFRPLPGDSQIQGHRGLLVRKEWKGPINDADHDYLINLSSSLQWKRDIDFLVQETRKVQGTEIFKAGVLILLALAMLAAIAVAAATRVGVVATFVICLAAVLTGLTADQIIKPIAEAGATWANVAFHIIPNFHFFWMVDALADNRVIPWSYLGAAAAYGLIYALGTLLLGMALFETREVG
ncbi:MAG TPA: ABC transporter permease [Phycisphaerae bacterium]|nr:ABC transporter permease [Phycisphaerae bacterium]